MVHVLSSFFVRKTLRSVVAGLVVTCSSGALYAETEPDAQPNVQPTDVTANVVTNPVLDQARALASEGSYNDALGLLDTYLLAYPDDQKAFDLRLNISIRKNESSMKDMLREEADRKGNPLGDPNYVIAKAKAPVSVSQRLDLVEFLIRNRRNTDAIKACRRILIDHENDRATLLLLDRMLKHVTRLERDRLQKEREYRRSMALNDVMKSSTLPSDPKKRPRTVLIFEEDLNEVERQRLRDLLEVRIEALTADEAPLKDVLRNVFAVAGLNYVLLDSALGEETLSFELLDESVAHVLEIMQSMVAVQFNYRGGSVFVTGSDNPVLETEIIRLKSGLTNVTADPSLSSSTSGGGGGEGGGDAPSVDIFDEGGGGEGGDGETDLEKFLNAALTDGGLVSWPAGSTWYLDRKANVLFVRSSPAAIAEVKRLVHAIDYNNDQVLIEARFVEVSDEANKTLGVNWMTGVQEGDSGSALAVGIASGSPLSPTLSADPVGALNALTTTGGGMRLGVIGGGTDLIPNFSFDIQALEERGDANVLSEPKIVALNNSWGALSLVETITYIEDFENRSVGSSSLQNDNDNDDDRFFNNNQIFNNVLVPRYGEEEVGIRLQVRPSIARNSDVITLEIKPWVKELIGFNTAGSPGDNLGEGTSVLATTGIQSPQFSTRELSTRLHVKNGQTIVLGGLVSEQDFTGRSGVPGLSNVPGLGRLFRTDTSNFRRRKLLVFVTVHIMDPSGEHFNEQVITALDKGSALIPSELLQELDVRQQRQATAAAEAAAKRAKAKARRSIGVKSPRHSED